MNEPGSYRCTCPQGYVLSPNKRSCTDIDECKEGGVSPCRGGPSSYCFNTRGGYKCTDVSCPADYVPESGRKHRCRLNDESRRCRTNDVACIRRPVSVSYNFLTLVSNITIPNQGGINLFTMQSASVYSVTTNFALAIDSVRATNDMSPLMKADRSFFQLSTPAPHRSIVSIVRQISGPQDIILKLTMEMYHLGRFQASAVANIYIFITPYEF